MIFLLMMFVLIMKDKMTVDDGACPAFVGMGVLELLIELLILASWK